MERGGFHSSRPAQPKPETNVIPLSPLRPEDQTRRLGRAVRERRLSRPSAIEHALAKYVAEVVKGHGLRTGFIATEQQWLVDQLRADLRRATQRWQRRVDRELRTRWWWTRPPGVLDPDEKQALELRPALAGFYWNLRRQWRVRTRRKLVAAFARAHKCSTDQAERQLLRVIQKELVGLKPDLRDRIARKLDLPWFGCLPELITPTAWADQTIEAALLNAPDFYGSKMQAILRRRRLWLRSKKHGKGL